MVGGPLPLLVRVLGGSGGFLEPMWHSQMRGGENVGRFSLPGCGLLFGV